MIPDMTIEEKVSNEQELVILKHSLAIANKMGNKQNYK